MKRVRRVFSAEERRSFADGSGGSPTPAPMHPKPAMPRLRVDHSPERFEKLPIRIATQIVFIDETIVGVAPKM